MSRRRSRSGFTPKPPSAATPVEDRLTTAPAPLPPPEAGPPNPPARLWALGACALVLMAVGVGVLLERWSDQPPTPADQPPATPEVTEEEKLCERFARLRNLQDPAADALLGRVPAVPAEPVSPEEANRLQADYFLREPIEIRRVGPARSPRGGAGGWFVFVTRGNVAAPAMEERTVTGVERSQRTMTNPDLVVEVRDGKIYGVRAELHVGP